MWLPLPLLNLAGLAELIQTLEQRRVVIDGAKAAENKADFAIDYMCAKSGQADVIASNIAARAQARALGAATKPAKTRKSAASSPPRAVVTGGRIVKGDLWERARQRDNGAGSDCI
jgi:hypothetical protein